jgi:hypothetical protein
MYEMERGKPSCRFGGGMIGLEEHVLPIGFVLIYDFLQHTYSGCG